MPMSPQPKTLSAPPLCPHGDVSIPTIPQVEAPKSSPSGDSGFLLFTDKGEKTPILEVPVSFPLESEAGLLRLDNRSYDSTDNGIITDVEHLHAALNVMKCALHEMERIGPAPTKKVLIAA